MPSIVTRDTLSTRLAELAEINSVEDWRKDQLKRCARCKTLTQNERRLAEYYLNNKPTEEDLIDLILARVSAHKRGSRK